MGETEERNPNVPMKVEQTQENEREEKPAEKAPEKHIPEEPTAEDRHETVPEAEPEHVAEPEPQPIETEDKTTEEPIPEEPAPEPKTEETAPEEPKPEQPQPAAETEKPAEKPESKEKKPKSAEIPAEEVDQLSDDEEIMKFLKETEQKIYVVGTGGSGTNTLDRLFEMGIKGAGLVGLNTDARHLLKIRANRKIIIGRKVSAGRGAGSNPNVGEEAAKESLEDIKDSIKDASMVFVTCGLGGGTGTGSAPIIAQAARSAGALTVAVVTLPFTSEGKARMENAVEGLEKLKKNVDTLIVIKNDKLLNLVPNLPLNTAFKVCDEVLAGSVKGIAELVTKSGLVNVDFADLKTILASAGYAVIGLGEASIDAKADERAKVAVETALSSPLLDADISSAKRALINVIGGEDMTLKEAEFVVAETSKRINADSHIIWGSRIDNDMKRTSMKVLLVLAGVRFPQYKALTRETNIETLDLDIIG